MLKLEPKLKKNAARIANIINSKEFVFFFEAVRKTCSILASSLENYVLESMLCI